MRRVFALLLVPFIVVGCFSMDENEEELRQLLRLERITLAMASGANDDWPVSVELVRVADTALIDQLLGIETMAWFAEKGNNFRQANPEAHFDAWEIVPGTVVGPLDVEVDGDVAGVLFCGVRSASAPTRFGRDGDVVVQINENGCTLSGGEPSKKSSFWAWPWP